MNIEQCLAHCTWHHLRAIGRGRGLVIPERIPRTELLTILQADISRPGVLAAEIAALPSVAVAALQLLDYYGGWLPAAAFCQRFGPLREARRGRPDPAAPPPWREPASTTEQLYYHGLIYPRRRPRRRQDRETAGFTLPDDLAPLLPPAPALARPALAPAFPPDPPPLLFNLTAFLAYLSTHDCAPRQGRWLLPRAFRPLLDRLLPAGCAWIVADRRDRGETATRVPRAIHFLAESAGFIPSPSLPPRRYRFAAGRPTRGGCPRAASPHPGSGERRGRAFPLLPTLAWHHWLSLPPTGRYAALRRALLAQSHDAEERWRAYRLPGWQETRPLAPLHRLAAALRECPAGGTWLDLEAFLAGIAWRTLPLPFPSPLRNKGRESPGPELERDLLTGLLAWLGLAQLDHPRTPRCFRLTPTGAALFHGPDDDSPGETAPAPLRLVVHSPDEIALAVSPDCLPAVLYALATSPAVDWPGPDRARLTPAALTSLPAMELADLVHLLDAGMAEPLPAEATRTLYRWAHDGRTLSLRPALLLESDDPELLAYLAGRRGLRQHLRRAVGRRAVEVDIRTAGSLLRKLRRMGLVPTSPLSPLLHGTLSQGSGWSNAYLLLAARLYNRLPAPLRGVPAIPQAALDRLAAGLAPLEVELAGQLATETLDRILAAIEDRLRPPPPVRPTPGGLEQTLGTIRRALEKEQPLEMTYYTAGRNDLARRTVEPLRLEKRGGTWYLVAYCQLRRAERVFRVDRIQEVQGVESTSEGNRGQEQGR